MTNIFISWSGELSKNIAEELRKWIPSVLQFAKPYFTPSDVEKGTKWSSEISQKLSDTHVGIICLTPDNHQKPWILFEAGALSKDLDNSRLCSVLFGMDNSDLSGPLTTFQTTAFNKADFKKLIATVNDAGGEAKLARDTFEEVFEMWWPKLEKKINEILANEGTTEKTSLRTEREILQEILSLSRLTASKTKSKSAEFSAGALDHIISVGKSLLSEAASYQDKEILQGIAEIRDAVTHIARGSGNLEAVSDSLDDLDNSLKVVAAAIDKPRNLDDEIPF